MSSHQPGYQSYQYSGPRYDGNQHTTTHFSQPQQPVEVHGQNSNDSLRRSDYSRSGREERFNEYKKKNGYKYNLYSMIDEPWNRCCEFGTCGACCPPNQCIAKKQPRIDWL